MEPVSFFDKHQAAHAKEAIQQFCDMATQWIKAAINEGLKIDHSKFFGYLEGRAKIRDEIMAMAKEDADKQTLQSNKNLLLEQGERTASDLKKGLNEVVYLKFGLNSDELKRITRYGQKYHINLSRDIIPNKDYFKLEKGKLSTLPELDTAIDQQHTKQADEIGSQVYRLHEQIIEHAKKLDAIFKQCGHGYLRIEGSFVSNVNDRHIIEEKIIKFNWKGAQEKRAKALAAV